MTTINKPVTIDDLAGMVARGFANTDNSIKKLSERVDNLSERVDNLSERVDNMSERIDNMSGRLQVVEDTMVTKDDFKKHNKILRGVKEVFQAA